MFENLKAKLKSFFSKAPEKARVVEEEPEPEQELLKEVEQEVSEETTKTTEEIEKEPEVAVEPEQKEIEKELEIIEEAEKEKPESPQPEKKGFFAKLFGKKEKPKEIEYRKAAKPKGFLEKFIKFKFSEKELDEILWDLELSLLENDVAKEVTEKICAETKKGLLSGELKAKDAESVIKLALKNSLEKILSVEKPDILKMIKAKKQKPFVIVFFGFNGGGKTLTIAKFAKMFLNKNISVVLAAGDTFRAAAIEQLEEHAKKLSVPVIKQKKGADSAAVIYDAIEHASSKGIDVVLADTAGRVHTDINLMDELKKVVRVSKPDLKIFVGDSLTGNDAAEQAKNFNDAVGIDASVLTKADCDAKGGACISVSYMTEKPILYLGTGQNYEDIIEFTPEWFLEKIF